MPGFDTVSDMLPNVAIPSILNTSYGAGWNGVSSTAPAKDALYDEIARLEALATIIPNTYTPVQSSVTNANTFVFNPSTYYRIGNTVFVNGWMRFTPPAGGVVSFDITIPIASNFTATWHLAGAGGNGVQATSFSVEIFANTSTKKAEFVCRPSTAAVTTNTITYLFQYLVLP